MTYPEVIRRLGIERVCLGGCGLNAYRHRGVIDPFDVIHWSDRRFTRRGLRRLLLLVARRSREDSPAFLNTPGMRFYALWWDEQRANSMAAQLGVRFPAAWSSQERLACLASAGRRPLSRTHPAIYAWANR